MDLDEADRRVLREMQRDSSRSTAEIAEAVGLSQAACWRRIHRLKADGFILRQTVVLDRRKLGLATQVFAQVKLSATGRADISGFADAVRAFPEVLECYVLMGPTDFLLRIATADVDAYERFFFERLSKLPGVQDINSIVALSEIKPFAGLPV
jgi:Lrp/AsnC family transcriptional regulator